MICISFLSPCPNPTLDYSIVLITHENIREFQQQFRFDFGILARERNNAVSQDLKDSCRVDYRMRVARTERYDADFEEISNSLIQNPKIDSDILVPEVVEDSRPELTVSICLYRPYYR